MKACLVAAAACALALATSQPASAQASGGPAARLTLADAVAAALARNDRLATQQDAVTSADLGIRLARSAFQPRVTPNILGSFGQTNVSSQTYRVDLSERFVTGTEVRVGVGTATSQIPGTSAGSDIRFYNADTTVAITQPLLKGFGRSVSRLALTSAESRREEALRQQALAEQQVAVDVATAYYRVLAQESFVEVARQSVQRGRQLREAAEARLDAGLVSQLDLLRAQQFVTQAEGQLFDAQSAVEDARDQLLFLMGREAGAPFEIEPEIRTVPDVPDGERAVATALATRLDLRSRQADVNDAERRIRYSRNQLLPQVDVNLALTRRTTSDTLARSFGLDGYTFATFFTIAAPPDRTAQLIEFQNARLEDRRRRRDLALAERQVADDVRRAMRERDRLLRAVSAADASVDLSRQEAEVARIRNERGLSNNLDVIAAEGLRLQAESRRVQARADAAVAAIRLRAVLGILAPRTDFGQPAALPVQP
ncbi:MAG: TolC family protein [Vicinamibacterales bacterium]